MVQTSETGRAAAEFGRRHARQIAKLIGADVISNASNEAEWNGKRIVIKSAKAATPSIGVPVTLLDRVSAVLAAIQDDKGEVNLFMIPVAAYRRHMFNGVQGEHMKMLARRDILSSGKPAGRFWLRDVEAVVVD